MDDLKNTMKDVQAIIASRQQDLSKHGLLKVLDGRGTVENMKRMVPHLAFFVLRFQDVLDLA